VRACHGEERSTVKIPWLGPSNLFSTANWVALLSSTAADILMRTCRDYPAGLLNSIRYPNRP